MNIGTYLLVCKIYLVKVCNGQNVLNKHTYIPK